MQADEGMETKDKPAKQTDIGLIWDDLAGTLRHSFITAALTDGMSPLDVARIVGTSLRMIDKNYGHLCHHAARERLAAVRLL